MYTNSPVINHSNSRWEPWTFLCDMAVAFFIIALFMFETEKYYVLWQFASASFLVVMAFNIIYYKKFIKIPGFSLWILGIMMIFICSSLVAKVPSASYQKAYLLFTILIYTFLFVKYLDSEQRVEKSLNFFLIAGVIMGIYVSLTMDWANLTDTNMKIYELRQGRDLSGGNANIAGFYASISYACGLYFMFNRKKFLLYSIYLSPIVIMVFLSGSRKSLIFVIITTLVAALLTKDSSRRKCGGRWLITVLIIGIIYYVVTNVPEFYNIIGQRIEYFYNAIMGNTMLDDSDIMRKMLINQGWEMFMQRPLLGYGIDNFQYFAFGTYSHNNYLELLTGVGLIGTILYYSIYFYLLYWLYKYAKDGHAMAVILLSIIVALMFIEFGQVDYMLKPVYFILAISYAYISIKRNGTNSKQIS